jgi:hypothetical protein
VPIPPSLCGALAADVGGHCTAGRITARYGDASAARNDGHRHKTARSSPACCEGACRIEGAGMCGRGRGERQAGPTGEGVVAETDWRRPAASLPERNQLAARLWWRRRGGTDPPTPAHPSQASGPASVRPPTPLRPPRLARGGTAGQPGPRAPLIDDLLLLLLLPPPQRRRRCCSCCRAAVAAAAAAAAATPPTAAAAAAPSRRLFADRCCCRRREPSPCPRFG